MLVSHVFDIRRSACWRVDHNDCTPSAKGVKESCGGRHGGVSPARESTGLFAPPGDDWEALA